MLNIFKNPKLLYIFLNSIIIFSLAQNNLRNDALNQQKRRNLLKLSDNIDMKPQKIRITTSNLYDFGTTSKNNIVDDIITISLKYFQDVIWVFPQSNNIRIQDTDQMVDGYQGDCISQSESKGFTITETQKTIGIENSDYHIFFYSQEYAQDNNLDPHRQNFISNTLCQFHNDRPLVGIIRLDTILLDEPIFYLNNKRSFDHLVQLIQHQIFHLLGHSGAELEYFKNKNGKISHDLKNFIHEEYIDDFTHRYVKSSNVLQFSKDHFNCQDSKGILYSNTGPYLTDHPVYHLLINERMSLSNKNSHFSTVITLFSLAFLKDSNYYANVDLEYAETMEWGKNQGCNFGKECDFNQYLEHTQFISETQKKCTFNHQGIGQRSYPTECSISEMLPEYDCTNPSLLRAQSSKTYEYHDFDSKCFESDIIKTGETEDDQLRCYKNQCTSQGVEIILSIDGTDYTILCTFDTDDGAQKEAPTGSGLTGNLYCPQDLNRFCNMPRPCENYCSNKGYCLNQNGKQTCHCIDGYTGSDCSIQCANFVDLSNNCVDNCPMGQYYEEGSKICKSCNSCNYCSGPDVSQCRQCPQGQWELDGNCVTDCGDLKFQDKSTGTCGDCSSDCVNGCIQSTNNCLIIPIQYENNKEQAEDRAKQSIISNKMTTFILNDCKYWQDSYPYNQKNQCLYANELANDSECDALDLNDTYPKNQHEYWSRDLLLRWQKCWNHKYSLIKQKCWFFQEITQYHENIANKCMLFQPNENIYNYRTMLLHYDYNMCQINSVQVDQTFIDQCFTNNNFEPNQSCQWLEQQTLPGKWSQEYRCQWINCQDQKIYFVQENCNNQEQTEILIQRSKCGWWDEYQSNIRFDLQSCLQQPPPTNPTDPIIDPIPTDPPTDPTNPTDPTEPTEPTDPNKPGDGDQIGNPDNNKPKIKFSNILQFSKVLLLVMMLIIYLVC